MLQLDVRDLARMRGEEYLQAFLQRNGFTVRESRTLSNPAKIQLVRESTVQRLCELFGCLPNDLFRWRGNGDHVLAVLNVAPIENMQIMLWGLSKDMLEKMVEVLAQETKRANVAPVVKGGRLFLNVRRLMELRQEEKPLRALKRMGFTQNEAVKLLGDDRKSFNVSMLMRVCTAFKCLPNDVFDFEGPEGHVLDAVRKGQVVDLYEQLRRLGPTELRRVLNLLKNKKLEIKNRV